MAFTGRSFDADGDRLDSWKEIATFFRRDVRTVKRWEAMRGMPLHRFPGGRRAKVFAYRSELKSWLQEAPAGPDSPIAADRSPRFPFLAAIWTGLQRKRWPVAAGLMVAIGALGWSQSGVTSKDRPPHVVARTVDPAAKSLYLTGIYYWQTRNAGGLNRAIGYFHQAIARDPGYAPAYVGLANCYLLLREFSTMPPEEAYPRARAAAEQAIRLDPGLADAHATVGFIDFYWSRDAVSAQREFEEAIRLDPKSARTHQWYANVLTMLGQNERALNEIETAQALDPESVSILADKGLALIYAGRTGEAIDLLRALEQSQPEFLSPHSYLAFADTVAGRYADANRESEAAARLLHQDETLKLTATAEIDRMRYGDTAMLQALLKSKQSLYHEGAFSAYELAEAYSLAGNDNHALEMLRISVNRGEPQNIAIGVDPIFAHLHGQTYFDSLKAEATAPRNIG